MAFRDGFSIKLYDLHDLLLLVVLVSFFFSLVPYTTVHITTFFHT